MLMMMIPLMSDNKTLAVSMPYACSLVCLRDLLRWLTHMVGEDRCVCPDCTMRMFTGEHIGSPLPR